MATQRQIEANRRNAQSSTGPKTEAGKAASSANALSHGLTAADNVVLPEENPDEFERLREGVIADLAPAGALQEALAHRVAVLLWRLDRVARFEAGLFVHGQLTVIRDRVGDPFRSSSILQGLADLPKEVTQLQEKCARFKRRIDEDIQAQAPSAQVLVERRQSARAFDQIARHEAMLQRSLNRTLDEFRRLRDASAATAESKAPPPAAPADPDPAPARDVPPPASAGPQPDSGEAQGEAGRTGEKAFLQNEANSAQTPDIEADSGAGTESPHAGTGTPRGRESPAGPFQTG